MTDKAIKLYEVMKIVDQKISNYEEFGPFEQTGPGKNGSRERFCNILLKYDIQINESPFMDDLSHLNNTQIDQLITELKYLYNEGTEFVTF